MHTSRSVGLLGVMLVLLACKQSEGDTGSSPASSGPEDARVAAVGIGGTLAGAESDARGRASKGESTLVGGQLSGIKDLCVGVAWKVPTKSRRALFLTVTGPTETMRSQRVEPGATGGLCLEQVVPGSYSLSLSQGPSIAEAPTERLPKFSVTVN
ncbi:MAG: hypothetical protein KC766_40210 [Myxococcales bacterium]|nr:hypothetical protein [Myxococcales bacterium]